MFESPFSKRDLIITLIFAFLFLGIIFILNYYHSQTIVVFCDVGQGDATYIRIKNRIDLLIDAGPNRRVLDCLGKYMPFYDRTIELAIISHAQKDHFGGYLETLDRYKVQKFWMSEIYNDSNSFDQLLNKIEAKNITIEFPKANDRSEFFDIRISFVWPSLDFIKQGTEKIHTVHAYFKQTLKDLNDFSLIFKVELGSLDILFTGDASPNILNRLTEKSKIISDILKVPHHGSKNGLTAQFLNLADTTQAVISNGKNNSYGHPDKKILDLLKAQNTKIRRTDMEGDIVFKLP